MKKKICKLCGKFYDQSSGQFTIHLEDEHKITLEKYVIYTEYNNIPPKCKCGLCEELPDFYRGYFREYAKNHRSFKIREKLYIEKFGVPTCLECGKEIGFNRANPRKFCSHKCSGEQNGFSLESTQKKIINNVTQKYGVDNVSKLDFVKKKISKIAKEQWDSGERVQIYSQERRNKISLFSKNMWKSPEYRRNFSKSIKKTIYGNPKELERRRQQMINLRKDPEFIKKMCLSNSRTFSKLHQKIRIFLKLEKFGFYSEQIIHRYIVDELNENLKLIIEINGDYFHANPKFYKKDDIIKPFGGAEYTSEQKWESDRIREEFLKNLGYDVFVIWESDNLDLIMEELRKILIQKLLKLYET